MLPPLAQARISHSASGPLLPLPGMDVRSSCCNTACSTPNSTKSGQPCDLLSLQVGMAAGEPVVVGVAGGMAVEVGMAASVAVTRSPCRWVWLLVWLLWWAWLLRSIWLLVWLLVWLQVWL